MFSLFGMYTVTLVLWSGAFYVHRGSRTHNKERHALAAPPLLRIIRVHLTICSLCMYWVILPQNECKLRHKFLRV